MGCKKLQYGSSHVLLLILVAAVSCCLFSPTMVLSSFERNNDDDDNQQRLLFNQCKNYEGSSDLVNLEYHMGPVLAASPIKLYTIWYGHWNPTHQSIIRDFLLSLSSSSSSSSSPPFPSVADWWHTVRLYTDQTGANITGNIILSGEYYDSHYSHGASLTRLTMQSIIKTATTAAAATNNHQRRPPPVAPLPLNPYDGLYLVLTSSDVQVQDFCRAVCGFHYFTFPAVVGVTVPYAWVGYSGVQCPGICAYPFAWPNVNPPNSGTYQLGEGPNNNNNNNNIMGAPNGDVGADGMISVIAHELAEVTSNPLVNAWYAGNDPTSPTEIADLCVGVYGSGGGGAYPGQVYRDSWGKGFNLNGINGRRFLVQWVWNPITSRCFGPNAMAD
ncbi:protein EXORDIUM-like 7 [Telopea speciosissima]|uniref:protein EXORDIUM-like 7 n=1 Tax=Telopea speciosissima TaxID=54955 RepID=UPI001CC76FFB|nr:protein EXORDIUM-like 7 [Telopea speciosissima]